MKGQPDYKSLESMNALLIRAGAGFTVSRDVENVGTTLSIWQGSANFPGAPPRLIGFLGFKVPSPDALDIEFDTFASYCFVAKVQQGCFEDENFRYYFSLEFQCLFVLDTKVSILINAPTYFKPKDQITPFLDNSILELPEA